MSLIIVSACLCGIKCRYNGKDNCIEEVKDLVNHGKAIPLCPEILGGLSVPRQPCEMFENIIIDKNGIEYTEQFEKGANVIVELAQQLKVKEAILKSNSPSCGFGRIYDGTFSKKLIQGNGITAEALNNIGVKIYNELSLF